MAFKSNNGKTETLRSRCIELGAVLIAQTLSIRTEISFRTRFTANISDSYASEFPLLSRQRINTVDIALSMQTWATTYSSGRVLVAMQFLTVGCGYTNGWSSFPSRCGYYMPPFFHSAKGLHLRCRGACGLNVLGLVMIMLPLR